MTDELRDNTLLATLPSAELEVLGRVPRILIAESVKIGG